MEVGDEDGGYEAALVDWRHEGVVEFATWHWYL